MSKFNVGDRVIYNRNGGAFGDKYLDDAEGEVVRVYGGTLVSVHWDGAAYPRNHNVSYLTKVTANVVTLNKGDRVKYTGTFSPELKGQAGTVESLYSDNSVMVKWDDSDAYPRGVFTSNVEKIPDKIEPTFKTGDRVKYTGKSIKFHNPSRIGMVGTVKSALPASLVVVDWDNTNGGYSTYPENLEKIEVTNMNNTYSVSATPTAPPTVAPATLTDMIEGLRENADLADEFAEAYTELARKLNDAADAFETVAYLSNPSV